MIPHGNTPGNGHETRRELLQRYVRLQRELLDADPASSAYQGTIHAFRQMGYVLITSGFEEDLDRLLRMRVLDGGRATPAPPEEREVPEGLQVIERRNLR